MKPDQLRAEFMDAESRGETMGAPHVTIARALYRIAEQLAEFNGNFRMINGIEPPQQERTHE